MPLLSSLNSYTPFNQNFTLIKRKGVCVPYNYELMRKDGTQILKLSRNLRGKGTFCRTRGHFFVGQGDITVKIT